jgi:hypothetical protein
VCFYKNWNDPQGVNTKEEAMAHQEEMHQYLNNFILETLTFYEHEMQLVFLSPASSALLNMLVYMRTQGRYRSLPFLHTKNYKHYVHIDVNNAFGCGVGALIS